MGFEMVGVVDRIVYALRGEGRIANAVLYQAEPRPDRIKLHPFCSCVKTLVFGRAPSSQHPAASIQYGGLPVIRYPRGREKEPMPPTEQVLHKLWDMFRASIRRLVRPIRCSTKFRDGPYREPRPSGPLR